MKIGIFDSGKGGAYVLERLKIIRPEHTYIAIDDHEHVPYGDRTHQEIITLTDKAIQPLIGKCDIIVLACNTATSVAINVLRARYQSQWFVGYEPMLKPAAMLSKAGHITVLSTKATRTSERYLRLKDEYAHDTQIDTPDTDNWALSIENDHINDISMNEIAKSVASGSDVIVLACTHYLVLKDTLVRLFPTATVIEPTYAVAKRIDVLSRGPLPRTADLDLHNS